MTSFKIVQWTVVSLGIIAIVVTLLVKMMADQASPNATEILAICFLGLLFVLSSNVENIKSMTLGREGFSVKLDRLQIKTSENDQAITELVLLSMGPDTYLNLKKLASGSFGHFTREPHIGLHTELYYLRNLGYIELVKERARSISEMPEEGPQLSDFIRITAAGQKYISLREKYLAPRRENQAVGA